MVVPEAMESAFQERFAEYSRTLDCIHCGLCISSCPTYEVTGRESDSPRGRIYLMRGYAERDEGLSEAARLHLDQCIVCRACETVCPSGIHMGDMMETLRHELGEKAPRRTVRGRLGRLLLERLLPHRSRVRVLSDFLWLYQVSGLRWLAGKALPLVSPKLGELHARQPSLARPSERRLDVAGELSVETLPARGPARMRVGLFLGCIASDWFAATHRATLRVLRRNGCDVVVPRAQTCCGALHRHAGLTPQSVDLFARNVDAFDAAGVDLVVVNAAGCGAALKEPPHGRDVRFSMPVRDICEFLDEIGIVAPTGSIDARVAYDPPCHLQHAQQVGPEVVDRLLAKIPGLAQVPLADRDRCCGSGGIYSLVHPEVAEPLAELKRDAIIRSGAEILVTGNPGCLMQIRSALAGEGVRVMHPIELLDEAYEEGEPVD